MDYKILMYFIFINYMTSAHEEDDDYFNYSDEYDNTLSDDEFTKKPEPVTEKPHGSYQVTEDVDDIPDNRTKGPIVVNYTIHRPLNTPLTTPATKHIDKKNLTNHSHNIGTPIKESTSSNNTPYLSVITDYFTGLKEGIVSGFNSVFNKHNDDFEDNSDSTFLRKLHRPSLFSTFSNGLFRR